MFLHSTEILNILILDLFNFEFSFREKSRAASCILLVGNWEVVVGREEKDELTTEG